MTEEHSSPIKTPRQLIIVVVAAFVVPIALAVLVSQLVTSGEKGVNEDNSKVLSRIQPVAAVMMAEATGPKGMLSGQQVYEQVCKVCHDAGLAGAPKFGDKAAWAARIASGEATLDKHAIGGYQGKGGAMPAKGGNADLTDDEVRRAVVWMANAAGATWKEPAIAAAVATSVANTTATSTPAATPTAAPIAATATTPVAAAAAAPVAVAAAAPAADPAATGASKADGKKIYESTCTVCHGAGIAGAPKFGDKAQWAPRIAQGLPVLYTHAIAGYTGKGGVMPPKGGNTSLSDADVQAAVAFMVAAAK